MEQILRDPVWQFVGAVLALLAIVVTFLIYLSQRNRKALSYEVLSKTLLVRGDVEVRQNLQILFNGTPVQDVYLLQIRIINSGNIPIITADYASHLAIRFTGRARLLTTEISETSPVNLKEHISLSSPESTGVSVSPALLNSGDFFVIKMLVSQLERENSFAIEGRIAGVSEVCKVRERQGRSLALMLAGMVITVVAIFQLEKFLPSGQALSEKLGERWYILVMLVAGYGLMIAGIIGRRKLLFKVLRKVSRTFEE